MLTCSVAVWLLTTSPKSPEELQRDLPSAVDETGQVAEAVTENVRPSDFVFRYGGEEFTVLLPLQYAEDAVVVAERLRAVIEATPCRTAQGPIPMTVSIGVAYHEAQGTLEQTLQRADERLYIAKQTGRNRVVTGGA